MSWGMVAGAAVSLIGGSMANRAEQRGQDAQREASEASIEEQRRQYDLTRQDQMPFLEAGYDSLGRQQAFLDGDRSGFENDAGYLFNREEMERGLNRRAAAGGSYRNNGTDVDMARMLSGFANSHSDSYWNRLAGRAGQGQTTASGLGALGMGMANSIGNIYGNTAAAQASSYQRQGDIWGQTAAGVGGAFNYWAQNRNASGGGWGGGGGGGWKYPSGGSGPYKG
ncbi:hypothetical protein [Stutzerimonas kunmingensis]|uniref:hypothetical protein n=1 Tax=Stutzerimonas kunmingensis TaxID=1211807 RepID=UPI002FC7D0A0